MYLQANYTFHSLLTYSQSHHTDSLTLRPHAHRPTPPKGDTELLGTVGLTTGFYLGSQFLLPYPQSSLLAGRVTLQTKAPSVFLGVLSASDSTACTLFTGP